MTTEDNDRLWAWSEKWINRCSQEILQSKLSEARKNYKYACWLHQDTARLLWESRIEVLEGELQQRDAHPPKKDVASTHEIYNPFRMLKRR